MNKIKIITLFVLFSVSYNQAYSQTYKFETSGFSVLEKKEKGKLDNWSDLSLVNLLVSLDTDKNRIVIYSQIIQLFEIVDYHDEKENETDLVYSFSCKDNNGDDCTISIITRKKQEYRKQLYINYDDRIIVYNISNI